MSYSIRQSRSIAFRAATVLALVVPVVAQAQTGITPAQFEKEVIDDRFQGGYGVTITDVDGDGALDVVALAYRPSALAWYRQPEWRKATVETGLDGLIDVAPHDVDGDGHVDLAVASAFDLGDSNSGGQVSWLRNPLGVDAGADGAVGGWSSHPVASLPTSHRLRWADVSGTGTPVLINLPIIGTGATAPDYRGGADLTAYTVPEAPTGPWPRVVLDRSLEMAHGLHVVDWDRDGREELLTASFNGVDLITPANRGQFVTRDTLLPAEHTGRPSAGMSDVVVGQWHGRERFLATLEPWHGHEVVVHVREAGEWQRAVVDDSLASGHALLAVDLDNDGRDEVIAGGRGEPYALNIYRYSEEARRWQRTELDSEVAVSGLAAADLDGNGYQDIVAVGAATANVVIYHNTGR